MSGVLVDTSVWVDHFRHGNYELYDLLANDAVLTHPMIVGEIACGTPPQRAHTLAMLGHLRPAQRPSAEMVLAFIERRRMFGLGCGLVDLTLLASTLITPGATLWTLDLRLIALAERLGRAHTG